MTGLHADAGRRWSVRISGVSAEQAFALLADVERYPDFVPGCLAARVVTRMPGRWMVENRFGIGPLRLAFRSEAIPDPPHALRIVSTDGPWRRLVLTWTVREDGDGCVVGFAAEAGFRSPILGGLARAGLADLEPRIIRAFELRARTLCGSGAGLPSPMRTGTDR